MSNLELEPASFRDPASTVAYLDGRVLRGLTKEGAADYDILAAAPFFAKAMDDGKLVGTTEVPVEDLPQSVRGDAWVKALEHERIPFVTYPYEWTFSMLKDATLVHLDLLLAALGADLTMKDGYAYNLAFTGARPVFIDIGSFERVRPGEPWAGYRQFCQTMLYPLLLQAHKDVRFQPWLRGAVQGIQPQDLAKLFTGTDKMKPGVLKHVSLHGAMDQRYSKSRAQDTQKELKAAGFSTELQKATVEAIRKLVARLDWGRSASEWNDYQRTSTYTDAEREIKAAFVARSLEGRGPGWSSTWAATTGPTRGWPPATPTTWSAPTATTLSSTASTGRCARRATARSCPPISTCPTLARPRLAGPRAGRLLRPGPPRRRSRPRPAPPPGHHRQRPPGRAGRLAALAWWAPGGRVRRPGRPDGRPPPGQQAPGHARRLPTRGVRAAAGDPLRHRRPYRVPLRHPRPLPRDASPPAGYDPAEGL